MNPQTFTIEQDSYNCLHSMQLFGRSYINCDSRVLSQDRQVGDSILSSCMPHLTNVVSYCTNFVGKNIDTNVFRNRDMDLKMYVLKTAARTCA